MIKLVSDNTKPEPKPHRRSQTGLSLEPFVCQYCSSSSLIEIQSLFLDQDGRLVNGAIRQFKCDVCDEITYHDRDVDDDD